MADEEPTFPPLPTETEIYILPDGRVVVADLPLELTALAAALGVVEPCEVTNPPATGAEPGGAFPPQASDS
jgi:hypothetical protein